PVCTGVEITFDGASASITHNNFGNRDNSNIDPFAMIENIGSYNGQDFHLKLESPLPNSDDPDCRPGLPEDNAKCSIILSSNGAVTFYTRANSTYPIQFTLINALDDTPMTLPRFSFSLFDIGTSGRVVCYELENAYELSNLLIFPEFFWADDTYDTFACGGCQNSCCPVGSTVPYLQQSGSTDITANGQTFTSGDMFVADPAAGGITDVTNPLALTDFQQSQSARLVYSGTSSWLMAFGRGSQGGRHQFAGYTNIGQDIC
ncbi:hypothetical protein THAOC_14075, partial [Thalassiosira oceanica]